MGGSALKNCVLRRVPRPEYLVVEGRVLALVRQFFAKVDVPRYLDSKPDFGDVDCVCLARTGWEAAVPEIAEAFSSREVVWTSKTTVSLERDSFQIDLIVVEEEDGYDCMLNYLSYGDAGAIMGAIAKQFGLSFGMDGLSCPVFDTDEPLRTLGRVHLSKDFALILAYLGYDHARFFEGFADESDLFRWLSSSLYFRSEIWHVDDMDRHNRRRRAKRGGFQRWLGYLEELGPTKPNPIHPPDPVEHFSKVAERERLIAEDRRQRLERQSRLDGATIMRITGLPPGKQLGALMKALEDGGFTGSGWSESEIVQFYNQWRISPSSNT